MNHTSEHKPQILNMDKPFTGENQLSPSESYYMLNFKNFITVHSKKGSNMNSGNQYAANYPACTIDQPAGEVYAVKSFYSELTNESYSFHYNGNGVHYILRIGEHGCDIVYDGPCLPLSADPKREITNFRCWLKYDPTCKNQGGKQLYFVTGEFEGCIDVEASIETGSFSTSFFSRCSTGCEAVQLCVPDPVGNIAGGFVLLTDAEKRLSNLVMNTGFQFRIRYVYYDFRASIWSKVSTTFYQDGLDTTKQVTDFGRKIKLRIPVGNALVDKIEIAVSKDNSPTWRKIAIIDKYQPYSGPQEKWYQRQLGELPGYSNEDCSFDYFFYNDTDGEVVAKEEIDRNYNPHPRGAQGLIPIGGALGYYNYIKGNCPFPGVEAKKFSIGIKPNSVLMDKGLKHSGKYEWGFVITGDCGRFSFVYGTQKLEMQRVQELNAWFFRSFTYDATGMTFPSWAKELSIVRTKNQYEFPLQWKVDNFVRKDGNIILTIQSLNDYNEAGFFKTNTVYEWVEGDRVEFIENGANAGIFYTSVYGGILNYKILSPFFDPSLPITTTPPTTFPANYFNQIMIKDDGRLSTLFQGAIIEIQRPKQTLDNQPFYEIGVSIPIVNGKLIHETGDFHTFDTFLLQRKIGTDPARIFAHHSPNDYWPSKISDQGRVHVVNQYEDEKRFGRNLTINAEGQYNWFGDFEKTFPAPEHGDITAMWIIDGKILLAIGQHDNFTGQVGDGFLRVDSQGRLLSNSVDAIVSDPQPEISGKFGLQYDHIGSVVFGDGFAFWADVNRSAYVIHDYNSAKDAGLGKIQSYTRTRFIEMQSYNSNAIHDIDKYRFSAGYDRSDDIVMVTIKRLRDSGVNNEFGPYKTSNDTLVFHPGSGEWLGFASFTPEAYGHFNLFDGRGSAFLTYQNGVPHIHPVIADKFNEFYGIACDQCFWITLNKYPSKEKRALSAEIKSKMMWYAPEVTVSDDEQFVSEVPPAMVKKSGNKWNFGFLNNRNSIGGIYNRSKLVQSKDCRGHYVNVVLVRDNTLNLMVGSFDNKKRTAYNETDLVLIKFALIEQSGFSENN